MPLLTEINRLFYCSQKAAVSKYSHVFRNCCWDVNSLEDYKIAPFHILATEGAVHVDKTHKWHMETIREICLADENFFKCPKPTCGH